MISQNRMYDKYVLASLYNVDHVCVGGGGRTWGLDTHRKSADADQLLWEAVTNSMCLGGGGQHSHSSGFQGGHGEVIWTTKMERSSQSCSCPGSVFEGRQGQQQTTAYQP